MNIFEIGRKTNQVAEYWGDRMPMMAMEEAGEFIQAISKYERALVEAKNREEKLAEEDAGAQADFERETEEMVRTARQNLIDEFGDMWITLLALQSRYEDGSWGDDIDKRIESKLSKKY